VAAHRTCRHPRREALIVEGPEVILRPFPAAFVSGRQAAVTRNKDGGGPVLQPVDQIRVSSSDLRIHLIGQPVVARAEPGQERRCRQVPWRGQIILRPGRSRLVPGRLWLIRADSCKVQHQVLDQVAVEQAMDVLVGVRQQAFITGQHAAFSPRLVPAAVLAGHVI